MSSKNPYGSKELADEFNNFFYSQTNLVSSIVRKKLLSGRAKELSAAIHSTVSTAVAISILAKNADRFYAECIMLSRGFFERIVNLTYLLVCDEDKFIEYREHTQQKVFRRLEQEFHAGDIRLGMKHEEKNELAKNKEINRILKKFMTKSGKEIKKWPNISIPDRLKVISQRTKANIGLFLHYQLMTYTDASEALHGSFYGATFWTGVYTPGVDTTSVKEAYRNLYQNLALLLVSSGELIHQFLLVLSKDNNIADFLSMSIKNSEKAYNFMNKAVTSDRGTKCSCH